MSEGEARALEELIEDADKRTEYQRRERRNIKTRAIKPPPEWQTGNKRVMAALARLRA